MTPALRSRLLRAAVLPALLLATAGCDIVTAEFKSQESAEWRKSFPLQPGGTVEIVNVNGKIEVQPSSGDTVEVVAVKSARGSTPEAAKELLSLIEIAESAAPDAIRIETKVPRPTGMLRTGNTEVSYTVRVPASAGPTRFTTVNGGLEVSGLRDRVTLQTTNGGIEATGIGGPVEATTTNGGVRVDVTRIAEGGVRMKCTNGGLQLRLPADARATISASVTNGGIQTEELTLDTMESSRRRLEARLNGGGPAIELSGVNGGVRLIGRR